MLIVPIYCMNLRTMTESDTQFPSKITKCRKLFRKQEANKYGICLNIYKYTHVNYWP